MTVINHVRNKKLRKQREKSPEWSLKKIFFQGRFLGYGWRKIGQPQPGGAVIMSEAI